MQTSTKRPPKVAFNPFVKARFAIQATKQKVYLALLAGLNSGALEWTSPTFYKTQNPPKRRQGRREMSRRVRQLEAGQIHIN